MHGSLSLDLAVVAGRTRPTRIIAVPPLQCSRVRYDDPHDPGVASLTIMHLGGVLQGDQLRLEITLDAHAAAHLTTAAAAQIYRMPEQTAAQTTMITVHPGARLHYLPEPTILFAGARYSQTTMITLHEGATLVLREMLVFGRLARGELHLYDCYRSTFEVSDPAGRCLLAERGLLEPARFSPTAPGIQAAYPILGSLYVLAPAADLAALLGHVQPVLHNQPNVLCEAGILPHNCGILIRALGSTVHTVRTMLDAALRALR